MKPITLRNLPDEVARAIRKKAETDGTSLNKAVIGLLEERVLGAPKKNNRALHHDFDKFAGTWTAEEAERFDKILAELRQIDPEVWE